MFGHVLCQSALGGWKMDWNKTKSIFIGVFLILNIFLYSQYLKSYNESKQLSEGLGEKTKIEAGLKEENITYIYACQIILKKPRIFQER